MAEQKIIEEQINKVLSGDAQKNALDFVAFLRANEISLDYNAGESENRTIWNGAVGGVVGNSIGYITINGDENCPGPWTFWLNSCDFDGSDSADDEFKNAIWAFASPCGRCNENWEKCMGSGKRTILGREFENQCHSPLMFCNPDAKTLENMKKFLLYLKPEIDGIQAEIERERAEKQILAREKEFKKNLSGELLTNALDFAKHMDETSGWAHSDEGVCFTVTDPGNFYIFVYGPGSSVCNSDFNDYPISDEMREFVYANISQCAYIRSGGKECGCSEKRWRSFTVLGKQYDNLCYCCICFKNPDGKTFEKIKELVPVWKLCIDAAKQAAK